MFFCSDVLLSNAGADVSHPGPGSMFPSMASVVASLDPWAARYTGRLRVQPRRVEIIEELGAMVMVSPFDKISSMSLMNKTHRNASETITLSMERCSRALSSFTVMEYPRARCPRSRRRSSTNSSWVSARLEYPTAY